jgi:hypothetical protein
VLAAPGLLVSVTRPDFVRSAGRRFDGNLYAAAPAELKWAFSSPKTAPEPFAGWKKVLEAANGGRDADGGSTTTGAIEHSFDPATTDLVLRLPQKTDFPLCKADDRVAKDFYDKPLVSGGERPTAGPFAALKPGDNRFRLWSGPLPERREAAGAAP